jgi:hypothetical protein
MKKTFKSLFFLMFILVCVPCQSQTQVPNSTIVLDNINVLNKFVSATMNLFNAFKAADNTLNKDKSKAMAVELYSDVSNIIRAKEAILFKLRKIETNLDLTSDINDLTHNLDNLKNTLLKYDPLIKSVGMDAEKLNSELKADLDAKSSTLNYLRYLDTKDKLNKQTAITYFQSGVNILKSSLPILEKF